MKRIDNGILLLTTSICLNAANFFVASFQSPHILTPLIISPFIKPKSIEPQFFASLSHRPSSTGHSHFRHYSNAYAFNENTVEYNMINDITLIPASIWDNCLPPSQTYPGETISPFLKHAFLSSLELSQCVAPHKGWLPRHLQIKVNGELAAFVPIYIKSHSMGEFIFDAEWADYAKQKGIRYYPKLLVGSPFSPVTCEKILLERSFRDRFVGEEGEVQRREFRLYVGKILQSIVKDNRLSSAHINFVTEQEALDLAGEIILNQADFDSGKSNFILQSVMKKFKKEDCVYIRKTTLQYHWVNVHKDRKEKYSSFDDYLSCFKSKKRITIKRERQRVLEQNVRVDAISGKDIGRYPGLVERMYEIYKSTVDKMFWGNLYFNLDFFELLVDSHFVENLVFMCARFDNDTGTRINSGVNGSFDANDVFAGSINVVENGVFHGRYWGCLPDNNIKNLHFEVCYWKAIEFCIKNGLDKMEPGAGGADYKWVRGFDPVLIHSVHFIAQPSFRGVVRDHVQTESERQVAIAELLNQKSSFNSSERSS